MADVITKSVSFALIVIMGYLLKKIKILEKQDFYVFSKIVLKITLPCAVISNFSKISLNYSMLLLSGFGLAANIITVAVGYIVYRKRKSVNPAFAMINLSGFNIGCFTSPFVQSFLGTTGFAATSFFDAGNSVMCTGLTYTIASLVSRKGEKISIKLMLKNLFSSLPFDAYLLMTLILFFRIKLPDLMLKFTETVGNANAFMALLMIGIGFEIHFEKEQLKQIVKLLFTRYAISYAFAWSFYMYLPFALEIRQAVVMAFLGPVSAVAPAFTGKIEENVEMSSAINSLSIMISMISMTAVLAIIL